VSIRRRIWSTAMVPKTCSYEWQDWNSSVLSRFLNVRNVSAEWVWTPREFQTAGAAVQDYDVLFKTSESGGHQQYWAPFQEVRGLAPSYLTSLTPMITTKEMATYRHWSVSLWWDPDDVSHCRILFPDKTECQLISAILCGWRRCLMADSYG